MNRAAGDLILPNHFATNNLNTAVNYKGNQEGWHDQTQAVFASVETGWNNMLFLTLTGRNDWASQLAYTDNKSYFYWSAGLSAVISNMVEMPSWLTFMKMRGSYSQVASPFDRFLSNPSYKYNDQTHNWSKSDTYPAYDLKPEDTRSWELGLNVRFLESLSLDVTYEADPKGLVSFFYIGCRRVVGRLRQSSASLHPPSGTLFLREPLTRPRPATLCRSLPATTQLTSLPVFQQQVPYFEPACAWTLLYKQHTS